MPLASAAVATSKVGMTKFIAFVDVMMHKTRHATDKCPLEIKSSFANIDRLSLHRFSVAENVTIFTK